MTPRLAGRLQASFFLKILLVFVGGSTAVVVYLAASFWLFDWQQGRLTVRRTALNYGELVLQELPDPPDTTVARAVASSLGVGMRIEGPGMAWVSDTTLPSFADVDLPVVLDGGPNRGGYDSDLGFGADLVRGDYRYLFALQAGSTVFGTESTAEEVADALFMIVLLACVYLATRRLVRPVRILSEGVERLRQGDLDVEMRTHRTDELGRLMASFNEMAGAIRDRIRARDQLLVDVSHEIRSPLTRMRIALEMIPDGSAKASVVEDIEEVEAMVSELLETERLDSPHGGLSLAPVDLAELVRESVEEQSGHEPGIDVEGIDRPVPADVDAERIRMVLGNLVSNALRHSDGGGPPVRVALQSTAGEAVITVRDSGDGIAADDLTRIFEPFYRVDRSRSKDTGGYGIGLSLVKRIVEAHGGRIDVESSLGEGTSVRFTVPAAENGRRRNGAAW